jgi:hypothetical protein
MMSERSNASLRPLRAALVAGLMVAVLVGTAIAGPVEDAIAAYRRGDYATALRLLRPLATPTPSPASGLCTATAEA